MTDETTDPDLEMLEARVKIMRKLGVTRWRDIDLGPDPTVTTAGPEEDPTQRSQTRERQDQERARRLQFGASGGPRLTAESRIR